ncbi:MAG: M14 family zinc carboxypeptidase [Bacteroidota bacterium]
MRKLILLHALVLLFFYAAAQQEKYSQVKINMTLCDMKMLAKTGVSPDDGLFLKGNFLFAELSSLQLSSLDKAGIRYEIVINDLSSYYQKRILEDKAFSNEKKTQNCFDAIDYVTPDNFSLGSMGGVYTFSEMLAELDTMKILFPGLITVKQPVDTVYSIEGRPVYYVKISDNPDVNENEPEVLYTALTHAREGTGMQQLFFYMYYLLENYSTNTDIKNLVDNTEMYFIPCVNPDGYVYNETTDPDGGGMWRKNRRNNGGGSYGIDLNRNFGYMWGYDDYGSSPFINDETYRGVNVFSEPETRAVRNFCNMHEFRIAFNHHTYSNLLVYPWGYIGSLYTNDSLLFEKYAGLMTKENFFAYGTANETVGYLTNGSSDDWMYGEQSTKPKIISMTPESGGPADGFWPVPSRIPEICKGNMGMNLLAAYFAGKYAVAEDKSNVYVNLLQGYFNYSIERLGLDSPATFIVSVVPLSSNIISAGTPKTYNSMSLLEKRNDSISYALDPSIQNGDMIQYVLSVDNGLYVHSDTITKYYGPSYIIFSDNGNTLNNWYSGTGWDITGENYYSSPYSITDSPYSGYMDFEYNTIETTAPVNLADALSARISFRAQWAVEPGADYVQLNISTDYGATWTPLCGKYSKPGNSMQAEGEPLYDGSLNQWVMEEIDLDDYTGQTVFFQFELNSDNYFSMDGFYFDDMKVWALFDTVSEVYEFASSDIFLSDPVPNPSSETTEISYGLNSIHREAKFVLADITGRTVYVKNLDAYNGKIKINSFMLGTGMYQYFIEDKNGRSEIKKMIVFENMN